MSVDCEYDCEGCGVHVIAYGISRPPRHLFCGVCAFLVEFVPNPDEMWQLYQQMKDRRDEG